jgi:hypothetical protein
MLEADLLTLRGEFRKHEQRLRQEVGQLAESMRLETQERKSADEATARRIEEVAIGGLRLELVGVWWLFAGVISANLSDEIACWLAR